MSKLKLSPEIKEILLIIKDILNAIFIAILIAIILKLFFFQAYFIPSSSMEDTLKIGDEILVWKFLYNNKIPLFNKYLPFGLKIKRGDIIVFHNDMGNEDYIKRCIAIGGDKITFSSNKIYLNGKILKENYIKIKNVKYINESYSVPKNYIFVLGDNRNNSVDSRQLGFISTKKIIGKAILIYYPIKRFKFLF